VSLGTRQAKVEHLEQPSKCAYLLTSASVLFQGFGALLMMSARVFPIEWKKMMTR